MKKAVLVLSSIFLGATLVQAQKTLLNKPTCTTVLGEAITPKALDTSNGRGVASNYSMWNNGQTILVKFMPGGGLGLRKRVMEMANEWSKYANITFKFVDDAAANTNIRIQLGAGYGHNSAVGTECNSIPQNMQTMNFDTLYLADIAYYAKSIVQRGMNWNNATMAQRIQWVRNEMGTNPNHWDEKTLYRTVVHEFGHSIGLMHEQSYTGAISWNKSDSVYAYYKKTQNWDKRMVDFNVFDVADRFYTNGTTYDPKSIMHYDVEPWQTTNGYSLKASTSLSEGDKSLIGELYPKNLTVSSLDVPRVTVSSFNKLDVKYDALRKGFVVKPSFTLATNSKLGTVLCLAIVYEDGGDALPAKSEKDYNIFGYAGTYQPLKLFPNTTMSYNTSAKDNFELFMPSDFVPDTKGKKIVLQFMVYQIDNTNGARKDKLFFRSNPSMALSMPK